MFLRRISLKKVWAMINILNLVIHLQTLNIMLPSNVSVFLMSLKDFISFKLPSVKSYL